MPKDETSTNVWSITGLTEKLQELLLGGALNHGGLDSLYALIIKEFKEAMDSKGVKLTPADFKAKVEELLWTKAAISALEDVVGVDLPLKKFSQHYKYIPVPMVEEQVKLMTGVSHNVTGAKFLKGVGRLGGGDELKDLDGFEFPKATIDEPFKIVLPAGGDSFSLSFINGANIGLRHDRIIANNPVRRALSYAGHHGDSAVILTNLIDLDLTMGNSTLKQYKAKISGTNINPNVLDPDYRARAKELMSTLPPDEVIYVTANELFLDIMSGWKKITHRKDGSPQFPGMVYVVFGYKEEELIKTAAARDLRYWTLIRQSKLSVEMRLIEKALADARKKKKDSDLASQLIKLRNELSRTVSSDIHPVERQRFNNKMLAFVVREFEKAIPNCKVIGQGTSYIRLGDEIIEINIPKHRRVADTLLADCVKSCSIKALLGKVARTAVVCHPYSLGFRSTVREVFSDGSPDRAKIFVAPICADAEFLRSTIGDSTRNTHPISRIMDSPQFKPGVLRLQLHDGIVSADEISIPALSKKESSIPGPYGNIKFITFFVATDMHFGARSREEVWCDSRQQSLGVADAVIQMMRDAGLCEGDKLPIHFYTANDDITQGNHYETQFQPDNRERSYPDIERVLAKLMSEGEERLRGASPKDVMQVMETMRRKTLEQFRARGSDHPEIQLQDVLDRHIEPNIDFFAAVLRRAEKAKLKIKGVSHYRKSEFDTSDIGVINFGSGNHFAATVQDRLMEGWIFARFLQAVIWGLPEWQGRHDYIKQVVRAPKYGNQFFGWGSIEVPGGYVWGVELRSNPTRLSSWADPLLAAIRHDPGRGAYNPILPGRVTVKVVGDKHFDTRGSTDFAVYNMGAAGTHTDPYGERGFPPNTSGVSFISLPVDGPDSGPIAYRLLHVVDIRRYFAKPYSFDWTKFLPNPA